MEDKSNNRSASWRPPEVLNIVDGETLIIFVRGVKQPARFTSLAAQIVRLALVPYVG
jgi:hypothetical protein